MTIKQQGGVFGRNPTFNNVEVDGALDVAGSVTTGGQTVDGTVEATKDGDAAGIFRRESSNGVVVQIYKDTNEAGRLGVFGTNDLWIGNNTCGLAFSDGLSSIYPVSTVGSGSGQNGTLDLGYSGVGFRDLYLTGNVVVASGKGIDFSATAGTGTSELFDDYEEGTWTATVGCTGNATTTTTVTAYYTKIGRQVTVGFRLLSNIDTTGLSGFFLIKGLPYACVSAATAGFAGSVVFKALTYPANTDAIFPAITNGASTIIFELMGDGAAPTFLGPGSLASGVTDINLLTLTYFTA